VIISDLPGCGLRETEGDILAFQTDVLQLQLDVRKRSDISRCIEELRKKSRNVDILVNNAGINRPAAGLEISEAEWDDHFATNVRGGMFLAQAFAPAMIERRWGRVVWISSQSGMVGIPGQPAYCSTKGAVIQLVRTLGLEWAKSGITVNSVAPTFVETNLTRRRLQDPEFLRFVLNKIPAGKLAEPEHVAAAVAFLASEEACMVNCHTLAVDGGWTAW
jgi:NAD(P)-dependent dehydrogenase (short-subunit alcohol dehydrogenase family)